MEILGDNLKKFFDVIDPKSNNADITYAGNRYEVWEVSDSLLRRMCNMSEDEFVRLAGEEAQWRSCTGSNLGFPDTKFKVNGETLLGWNRWDKKRKKYEDLSEYLCDCVGASTEKNICACAVDLAKYNNIIMGQLFKEYEGER